MSDLLMLVVIVAGLTLIGALAARFGTDSRIDATDTRVPAESAALY